MWDRACTSLPPNYYSSAAAVSYAYTSERWQWQCLEWQSNSKKGLFFFFFFFPCSLEQRSYSTNSQKYPYEKSFFQKLHLLFQKIIRISVDLDGLSPEWLEVKQQPTFSSFPHWQRQECSPQQWDFHFCCPCSSALGSLCTHYLFQEVGKLSSPVLAKIFCNIFTAVTLDAKTQIFKSSFVACKRWDRFYDLLLEEQVLQWERWHCGCDCIAMVQRQWRQWQLAVGPHVIVGFGVFPWKSVLGHSLWWQSCWLAVNVFNLPSPMTLLCFTVSL